jgi:predicted metal-dependent hydrolase
MIIKSKKDDSLYIKKILDIWYKDKAQKLFKELIDNSMDKFSKYQIDKPTFEVRQMDKRWGSCTKSGKILLNTELIKATKGSIEYVIIHELCHLIHHNHNKNFYELQNIQFPNWEKWKEKLEKGLS